MKNTTRKNELLNAIERFKRYKSLGKIHTLYNNSILPNNYKNVIDQKDKMSKSTNKKGKINKTKEGEREKESSYILGNPDYTYFLTETNKEIELNNNENKYNIIFSNSTTKNNDKINNKFIIKNANNTFRKVNYLPKQKPKKLFGNIGLTNKKIDPLQFMNNTNIVGCQEYSSSNYINSTVNTEPPQSNIQIHQYFDKDKSINNLTDFNTSDLNFTLSKTNSNSIIKIKNKNSLKKVKSINSSENNIALGNGRKNTNSLTRIIPLSNNNNKKGKNNLRKFYTRKLLREEHYYIDENGKEKIFEVTHSLIKNNDDAYSKNLNLDNISIKNNTSILKKTKKIYVNKLNNKPKTFKHKIPLVEKKHNHPTFPENNDNQKNINIHNNSKNLPRNTSQIQQKNPKLYVKFSHNDNVNHNCLYEYEELSSKKNKYGNNDPGSVDGRLTNIKYNELIKNNSFINNQKYITMNHFINNKNNLTKTIGDKNIKNTSNKIYKNRSGASSQNCSNHSYYEIKSITKQKTNKIDNNENELQNITAKNKTNLDNNQYNNTTFNGITKIDIRDINHCGINNSKNISNFSSNYRLYLRETPNISYESNKNYY